MGSAWFGGGGENIYGLGFGFAFGFGVWRLISWRSLEFLGATSLSLCVCVGGCWVVGSVSVYEIHDLHGRSVDLFIILRSLLFSFVCGLSVCMCVY